MYLLLTAGTVCILVGILITVWGIRQAKKRIADAEDWIETEAYVIRMDWKLRITLVHWIPLIVREYRPLIEYRTEDGSDIRAVLPYTLKMSKEYRDCNASFENSVPILIKYDANSPESCFYGDKKSFHIREGAYIFVVAALLAVIGAWLVWGQFRI